MALLLVDLDNFKGVNDTYGHVVGDKLLSIIGTRLRLCTRESDSVARVGGDEFAVILEDISTSQAVERVAEAIVSATAEPCILDGHLITCSTSVGGMLRNSGEDGSRNELFLNADTALYAAKHAGKARFVIFGNSQAISSDFDARPDTD
jgi:diguanylate cyclase (GGDEF)-like protein